MNLKPQLSRQQTILLAVLLVVYFLTFPGDFQSILNLVGGVLGLSTSISPWLYILAAVALVCWTLTRIFERRASGSGTRSATKGTSS